MNSTRHEPATRFTRTGGRLRNRISRQSVAPGTTLYAGDTVTVRNNGSVARTAA